MMAIYPIYLPESLRDRYVPELFPDEDGVDASDEPEHDEDRCQTKPQ
jgi:hypothetical protein